MATTKKKETSYVPLNYVPPDRSKDLMQTQKSSGSTGGVPMFSRIGKETVIRDLTFIDELAGNKGVESTFEQDRKKDAVNKNKNAGNSGQDNDEFKGYDLDDFYNNKMDSPTNAQDGEKKDEKKDEKSATQKHKEATKKNKTDKS